MCPRYSFPMSAKKSWDIERKPVAATRPVPVRAASAVKRAAPVKAVRKARPPVSSEPLKLRRKRAKKFFFIGLSIVVVLSLACLFYLVWLPPLRIQQVTAEGASSESVIELSMGALRGSYFLIVPRNSLFFIPESDIRKRILKEHPDIVAVSFKPEGLTTLHVVPIARTSAFVWCGVARETATEPCYAADPDGLIFAPYTGEVPVASSTLHLRMYAPIDGDPLTPIRSHLTNTESIPNTLQLARALKGLNANIAEVAFRGDEADFYTTGRTRITYIIGQERAAATLAASVFPTLSLNDGSVEYVDLRFERKVYLRKRGSSE